MRRKHPIKRKTPLKRSRKKIETPAAFDGFAMAAPPPVEPERGINIVLAPAMQEIEAMRMEIFSRTGIEKNRIGIEIAPPPVGFDKYAKKIDWMKMDEVKAYDAAPKSYITEDELNFLERNRKAYRSTSLQLWMRYGIDNFEPVCAECGKPLDFSNEAVAYGSQAHIMPKGIFKSIALHPANRVILGRWCCHGQYDSNWLNASRMKIWSHVKFIVFNVLIPALPQHEYRKLPDIIRDEYESLNRQ